MLLAEADAGNKADVAVALQAGRRAVGVTVPLLGGPPPSRKASLHMLWQQCSAWHCTTLVRSPPAARCQPRRSWQRAGPWRRRWTRRAQPRPSRQSRCGKPRHAGPLQGGGCGGVGARGREQGATRGPGGSNSATAALNAAAVPCRQAAGRGAWAPAASRGGLGRAQGQQGLRASRASRAQQTPS